MDSCQAVEKEIDKVIQKFSGIQSHSTRVLDDAIKYIEQLKSSIEEGKFGCSTLVVTIRKMFGLFLIKRELRSFLCILFFVCLTKPCNEVNAFCNESLFYLRLV